jgi:hypothetical protein
MPCIGVRRLGRKKAMKILKKEQGSGAEKNGHNQNLEMTISNFLRLFLLREVNCSHLFSPSNEEGRREISGNQYPPLLENQRKGDD